MNHKIGDLVKFQYHSARYPERYELLKDVAINQTFNGWCNNWTKVLTPYGETFVETRGVQRVPT